MTSVIFQFQMIFQVPGTVVKTTWSHEAPIPLPLRENSSLTSLLAIFVSISTAVIIKKHSSYDPRL